MTATTGARHRPGSAPSPAGLEVRPLTGTFGAEVRGLDLAALDDDGFAVLRALVHEHLFTLLPDQRLDPDAHVALGRRFGQPEVHPFIPKLEGHPEIVVLPASQGFVADVWHTDVTFSPFPPVCSVLHMVRPADRGGDTLFADLQAAFAALAPPLRELVSGLTAVHTAAVYGHPEDRAVHPVVRRHPDTGVPSLFVNRQFTARIVELSPGESDALLSFLWQWCEQPRFTCRVSWAAGDVGIWDNRATMHHAVNDYEGERVVHRVTVLGDHPEAAFPTDRWAPWRAPRISASASGLDRPGADVAHAIERDDRATPSG